MQSAYFSLYTFNKTYTFKYGMGNFKSKGYFMGFFGCSQPIPATDIRYSEKPMILWLLGNVCVQCAPQQKVSLEPLYTN